MDYEFIEEIENLLENEEYNTVIEKIENLDIEDYDIQTYIFLAHAYSCKGNDRKAVEILMSTADDVEDDDIAYYIELASSLYAINQYDNAIIAANKCIEIDDRFIDAWILLCYIYLEKGDKENLEYSSNKAQEIDADTFEEFFVKNTASKPLYYSKEDAECVLKHIEKYYGTNYNMIDFDEGSELPIMITVIPPTKDKNYYKLITFGMGAYKANVPEELKNFNVDRVELVAYLPPDFDPKGKSFSELWIVKYMKVLGNMMMYEDTWLGLGHTISNGEPFDTDTQFNGVILDFVHNVKENAIGCELPSGDAVTFYQFIPLYEEEMLYKIKNGCDALFNLFTKHYGRNYIGIIDNSRPNFCEGTLEKNWAIPRSSIEHILDWSGADGCFATDRIMVDNKNVGYMYRERPDNEYDSGWRFLAGDESAEYMNNSENMGIYSLNTVCNYDNDIMEFLDSPIGSAFYRNKKGNFIKDENFKKI